jgi:hypothetical protein
MDKFFPRVVIVLAPAISLLADYQPASYVSILCHECRCARVYLDT